MATRTVTIDELIKQAKRPVRRANVSGPEVRCGTMGCEKLLGMVADPTADDVTQVLWYCRSCRCFSRIEWKSEPVS